MRTTLLTWTRLTATLRRRAEAGMSTAEYAIGTIAAASFAALLIAVIREGGVREALARVIGQAFAVAG